MPQIDQIALVAYSQFFWLLLVLGLIYFGIGHAMLPKIQSTVDARAHNVACFDVDVRCATLHCRFDDSFDCHVFGLVRDAGRAADPNAITLIYSVTRLGINDVA